jgi:hypothetical protein
LKSKDVIGELAEEKLYGENNVAKKCMYDEKHGLDTDTFWGGQLA